MSAPRGLPDDVRESVSKRYYSYPDVLHSASWFLVSELAEVDYCEVIEDRRERRVGSDRADFYQTNNTVALGKGEQMTLREFLGAEFFLDLDALTACNADRIVFWFEL
ncbi:hypothetical protein [Pseudovibrio sp. Alg231-02]|uniref:hypothetical protein n=1 Tax=Pseudovibrio sp. Alg231-02 TaxID=1922223 RepID=UPI0007AE930D|nr:hypothetical protein [Pseudovibrio sp. Alg231-02]